MSRRRRIHPVIAELIMFAAFAGALAGVAAFFMGA
jgi:hypothetical protein